MLLLIKQHENIYFNVAWLMFWKFLLYPSQYHLKQELSFCFALQFLAKYIYLNGC